MKTEDIVTDRLVLKSMTLEECDFAAKLWGNPETGQYLNNPPCENGNELREIISDLDDLVDEYPFIIYDKSTDKPIGTCCLGPEGPEGCWGFGYDIIKELWGNGYATEVAKAMIDFAYSFEVRDFYCTVATDNIASCHVMEKCGLNADTTSSFKNHKTDVEHNSTIYKMTLK